MYSLQSIMGINKSAETKLQRAGIRSQQQLLKQCSKPSARRTVAKKTKINETKLKYFAKQAELFRIRGVGEKYAELLEASGVDSITQLASRKSTLLYTKLGKINKAKRFVSALPSVKLVSMWVKQAKRLRSLIH